VTITQDQKKEEAAVLEVLEGVYNAWNDGDADAFVAEYLENASSILPGVYMKSREEIRAAMGHSFAGPLKGTRAADEVLDVRFLNDEAAVVISRTGVLAPGETEAPPERTVFATWVLAKRDGKWLLAAYSNSPSVRPAGRPM